MNVLWELAANEARGRAHRVGCGDWDGQNWRTTGGFTDAPRRAPAKHQVPFLQVVADRGGQRGEFAVGAPQVVLPGLLGGTVSWR